MSDVSTEFRKPTAGEARLLRAIGARWPASSADWVERIRVRPLADGGMGSLELAVPELTSGERRLGGTVAELQFKDVDGVVVVVALNVDEKRVPYELDIWKTDFSPLRSFPESFDS